MKLFGQERNLMTSSIARMNCFLHGVEDFQIARGDTLEKPLFVEGDKLQQFDICLANPPYSIKQWNREAFGSDPWGRNIYGTPPQNCADYAFWQHIIGSLKPKSGRCAILFPHGVLFRDSEREMRRKLVEHDLIDGVIGLGKDLFYNSTMPSCVVICRMKKPRERRGKAIFIDAQLEVSRERAQSFLLPSHVTKIAQAYHRFCNQSDFASVVALDQIRSNDCDLRLPLYVSSSGSAVTSDDEPVGQSDELSYAIRNWVASSESLRQSMDSLFNMLGSR